MATKMYLTQRIKNLDEKLDVQVEVSKLIRSEVNDVRGDLSQIQFDLDGVHRVISGLDDKLLSLQRKQELANAGVMFLCNFVNGRKVKMPELIQEELKIGGTTTMGFKELGDILCKQLSD